MVNSCCILNCKNSLRNSKCEFYKFPKASFKIKQRDMWIAAVQKAHPEGYEWNLKPHHVICSEHFVGNKKSDSQLSPSYVPTIFSKSRDEVKDKVLLNRHERFLKRRMSSKMQETNMKKARIFSEQQFDNDENFEEQDQINNDNNQVHEMGVEKKTADRGCQVNTFNVTENSNSFTCVKYIYSNKITCDAEIQTDIRQLNTFEFRTKTVKDQCVGTCSKTYCDQEVTCKLIYERTKFGGYDSISEKQLKHSAGVTRENFEFLLKRAQSASVENKCKLLLKDRLYIFLIIMKTGLSFAALSAFFSVDETTISRIFFSLLHHLAATTSNLVFWPSKQMVQMTMPKCFKPIKICTLFFHS